MSIRNPNADFNDRCTELIAQKNFTELGRLIEKSQAEIPESIVRVGFKNYLLEAGGNKVKLFLLMKLTEITSVKPDDSIQLEACRIAMSMDTPQILEALVKRIGIDKYVFKNLGESIQKTYKHYIRYGKFMDISKLMEVTGTSPDDELVQDGYESYLMEVKFISFTGLKKQTKIDPDPDMILEIYQEYHHQLNNASADEEDTWLRRLRKLKKISGIDPPEEIAFELDLDM